MVLCLAANFDEAEASVGVQRGGAQRFQEAVLVDVVGAAAGHESAAWAQHFEGSKVEFFVAPHRGLKVALALGKGGRVENDGVIATISSSVVLEKVEGVSLDPLDVPAVEGCVLVGGFQGRTGAVDASYLGAAGGEVKGEASLIAENIESFAFGIAGCGGIVFALIEKGPGLLACKRVEMEADAVHGESCRAPVSIEQGGSTRGKSFQLANARVGSLND